jgi:hypothetical protein
MSRGRGGGLGVQEPRPPCCRWLHGPVLPQGPLWGRAAFQCRLLGPAHCCTHSCRSRGMRDASAPHERLCVACHRPPCCHDSTQQKSKRRGRALHTLSTLDTAESGWVPFGLGTCKAMELNRGVRGQTRGSDERAPAPGRRPGGGAGWRRAARPGERVLCAGCYMPRLVREREGRGRMRQRRPRLRPARGRPRRWAQGEYRRGDAEGARARAGGAPGPWAAQAPKRRAAGPKNAPPPAAAAAATRRTRAGPRRCQRPRPSLGMRGARRRAPPQAARRPSGNTHSRWAAPSAGWRRT